MAKEGITVAEQAAVTSSFVIPLLSRLNKAV